MGEKDYQDLVEETDGSNGCIELAEALEEIRRQDTEDGES